MHSAFILTGKMNASLAPCALGGDRLATTVCGHRNASGAFKRFFLRGQTPVCRLSPAAQARGFQSRVSDKSDMSDGGGYAQVARVCDSVLHPFFVYFVYFVVKKRRRAVSKKFLKKISFFRKNCDRFVCSGELNIWVSISFWQRFLFGKKLV